MMENMYCSSWNTIASPVKNSLYIFAIVMKRLVPAFQLGCWRQQQARLQSNKIIIFIIVSSIVSSSVGTLGAYSIDYTPKRYHLDKNVLK